MYMGPRIISHNATFYFITVVKRRGSLNFCMADNLTDCTLKKTNKHSTFFLLVLRVESYDICRTVPHTGYSEAKITNFIMTS